ncbi:MAG: SDR family NAD(P)-dependent oxidoreductase, partial [Pusillimonas sp.]
MNISLEGKVAIVTGASSGIGLSIAQAYLDCGAAGVVAVFRRAEVPEELARAQETWPGKLVIVRGDVAEEQTAIAFTKAALDHFGRIDVMVSNAAIS